MIGLPKLGVPDFAALLVNGRLPDYWQRELVHQAAQPKKVAQACHWLDELTQQHVPRLQSGPLLGARLAELAADAPPVAAPEEVAHPRAPRAAASTPSQASSASRRRIPLLERGNSGKPAAWSPARRADAGLLRKWAKDTAVSPSGKPTRQPLQPAQVRSRTPLPAISQVEMTQHGDADGLPARLAQRIRQQLTLPETAVGQPTSTKHSTSLVSSGAPAAPTPEMEKPTRPLEAQWQQPLFGQTAPQGLLAQLDANATSAEPLAARQTESPASPPPQTAAGKPTPPVASGSTPPRCQGTAPWEGLNQQQPLANPPKQPLNAEQARSSAGSRPQGETAVSETALPQSDEVEAGWLTAPRLAPPQLAERLPHLRPLPPPGTFANQPTAAATARKSAQHEATAAATEAPEALHSLARQIKQILDEESRRHGIEV